MLCACLGCRQSYCWRNTAYPGVRLDSSSPSSQVVSREVPNVTEEELRNNLQQLQTLIPDLKPGPTSKYADLAFHIYPRRHWLSSQLQIGPQVRVAARLDKAAEILLILREEFPYLNVSRLAAAWPQLLLTDPEGLAADVKEVP
ncbi:hypothetical protein Vretimale_13498 [Volvox reticuliferus]|uniref:Uncharacterized protein n=1 Tax=Volvox reticuliferus TaxID=1737510 RepID=A0A8J4LTT4_9CHLO|nr:hypothetical protein Vretimale_13498 [Volvox reticuliferus]